MALGGILARRVRTRMQYESCAKQRCWPRIRPQPGSTWATSIITLGKSEEAEQALERASKLGSAQGDAEPMVFSAIVHASRGERVQIDPSFFHYKPEEAVDGDRRNGLARRMRSWATNNRLSPGCDAPFNVEIITFPGSSATGTGTNCVETPNFSASCSKSRATGSTTTNSSHPRTLDLDFQIVAGRTGLTGQFTCLPWIRSLDITR